MKQQEGAIRAVIGESVRQRRKSVLKGILFTLLAAGVLFATFSVLFVIGFPAEQDNICVRTELQNGDGHPEWVIHFETRDGQPLYAYTKYTVADAGDGGLPVKEAVIHLRTAPLGHLDPGNYTWGYSVESGLLATEAYDFVVKVQYRDGAVSYSMRDQGLFELSE